MTVATALGIGMSMWGSNGVARADESQAAVAEVWDRLPPEAQAALQESGTGVGLPIGAAAPGAEAALVAAAAPVADVSAPVRGDVVSDREARRAERQAARAAEDAESDVAYSDAEVQALIAEHDAQVAAAIAEANALAGHDVPPPPAPAPAPAEAPAHEGNEGDGGSPADGGGGGPVMELVSYSPSSSCCDMGQLRQLAADAGYPPAGAAAFAGAVEAALLVREVLSDVGLSALVKTSGAKGLHVVVPLKPGQAAVDVAAATRAVAVRAENLEPNLTTTAFVIEDRAGKVFLDATRAGGATVVAAYSPRVRAGVPVSFPLPWGDLGRASPAEFSIRTVPGLLAGADPWATLMPAPQALGGALVEEGHAIPVARVAAMHEGKRRAQAQRAAEAQH